MVLFFSSLDNTMEKIARLFLSTTVIVLSVVTVTGQSSKSLAQIRGQGTEQFFDRGNQQIEREIQRLQNQQQQQLEQKDPKQQTLEIQTQQNPNPKKPENSPQQETLPSNHQDSNTPETQP
ncbi:hypothetical protein [Gloeothece verrucosa]|uniref:Uncharacterized protein n=1 Tax=Gloeothece verrucosa (strain PCC 7822) TaxID=497965 RepID=E0UBZ6_GLOV7|nr:hypothetical protein [Gloeothece verrucosa]ADN16334.1 hypothetical protein Cyan7822_4420 [Gloeothece verrucosa PCC 7822]